MGEEGHRIGAEAFAEKYRNGELGEALLLDVREEAEWRIYRLGEAILIPLRSLPRQLDRLDPGRKTYVLCAHGVRSVHAVNYLYGQGFTRVINVDGGLAEVSLHLGEEDVRPK